MAAGELLVAYAIDDAYGLRCRRADRRMTSEGKPFFSRPDNVHFNISHSGEYVLVGVDRAPVGVDIQCHTSATEGVARRIMSADAFASWKASADRAAAFFDRWVEKECALKWRGVGIGELTQTDAPLPQGVSVFRLPAPEGYSAAVCGTPPTPPRLVPEDQLLNVSC